MCNVLKDTAVLVPMFWSEVPAWWLGTEVGPIHILIGLHGILIRCWIGYWCLLKTSKEFSHTGLVFLYLLRSNKHASKGKARQHWACIPAVGAGGGHLRRGPVFYVLLWSSPSCSTHWRYQSGSWWHWCNLFYRRILPITALSTSQLCYTLRLRGIKVEGQSKFRPVIIHHVGIHLRKHFSFVPEDAAVSLPGRIIRCAVFDCRYSASCFYLDGDI